jgi:hypothetical protein
MTMTHLRCIAALVLALSALSHASIASAQGRAPQVENNGVFFELSGRLLGTYGTSHPGVAAAFGARIGGLRLGIGFSFSPASFKDFRFELPLPEGQRYRDRDTLRLGAQEIFAGVRASWVFEVPGLDWLDLEVPLLVGTYLLGTPMMDGDRDTPDGDRVSVWENRLLSEQDLNIGIGIDFGLVARVRPFREVPWLKIGMGFHYTVVLGIDQPYLPDTLHGPSGSLVMIIEN